MGSPVTAAAAAPERRRENLALAFQELLTAGERLRTYRQQVTEPISFRQQIWEGVKVAQAEALKQGYSGDDAELAVFAVVAYLDESILNLNNPVLRDWPRLPLQEERYGHHIAGEIFFQNLQKIMQRSESQDLADLLEVYYLCMLLGFTGRYTMAGRGELYNTMQQTGDKIRRIRKSTGMISPGWMLPANERIQGAGRDPLVKVLLFSAIGCVVLTIILFIAFKTGLAAGISSMRSIAMQSL
ncbi:MAG TPA: DotU family type IV/VI secretion system protein [Bryobacteraceae bacterium]|nr:DotU family type IV/VI secretion system protein [Bryobacteraceae bacterium]